MIVCHRFMQKKSTVADSTYRHELLMYLDPPHRAHKRNNTLSWKCLVHLPRWGADGINLIKLCISRFPQHFCPRSKWLVLAFSPTIICFSAARRVWLFHVWPTYSHMPKTIVKTKLSNIICCINCSEFCFEQFVERKKWYFWFDSPLVELQWGNLREV